MLKQAISKRPSSHMILLRTHNRSFYFSFKAYDRMAGSQHQRNVDFPLNLGFNEHEYYKQIKNQIYTLGSRATLFFRSQFLSKQFAAQYLDLLKAIKNQNYDAIEALCEEKLTTEIGAKMYEHSKFNNVQFRIANEDLAKVESVEIINHFFVTGMSIDRSQNQSLNQLKMVTGKNKNYLHYVDKSWNEEWDDGPMFSEKDLDFLLDLKKNFQVMSTDGSSMMQHDEQSRELKDPTHAEIVERGRFDKLESIRKRSDKAFDQIMTQEYNMVSMLRPSLLETKGKQGN